MTGAPNAKRLLNERLRGLCIQARADLETMEDLSRSFDLDLVEAMLLKSEKLAEVSEQAMELDQKMLPKVEHFQDAVNAYCARLRALRVDLGLD